ncbi:hypothetical protein [Sandarakinorhabdus sp.]|uniref:hypothetical protein n=1 Tax=Sandarakinorhabdus sp. TaxID=1916663 RepID=UPI003341427A
MTNDTTKQNTAPQEIDAAALDQVVGAGARVPNERNQEQADKLVGEQFNKK